MSERYEMLDYMRTMANNIVAVEAVADHVVEVAAELDATGQSGAADVLRMLARIHRVRSLELQCQLAALGRDYTVLGHDGGVRYKNLFCKTGIFF